MMCDSYAHDREVQVKWCVNSHSIVMIQRRAVEGRVCVYVCATRNNCTCIDCRQCHDRARDALTHITPDVPGLIGVSAEDRGASQQQAVQLLG